MREIALTQGQYALVDDADYEELSKYKWRALKNVSGIWYAVRQYKNKDGFWKLMSMHRHLLRLNFGDKRQGDHLNHNGLDNRRCNIRICNPHQNHANERPAKNGTSKFKGVSWCNRTKKWAAQIQVKGKAIFLGRFSFEELAALAYDMAAMKYFRDFANFNF